jgi:uncharacterized protein involved in outer membrane biogenesis
MKKLGMIILIIVVLLVAVVFTRNIIAKNAISAGVKAMTGLNLSIGNMDVKIMKSIVSIKEMKLYNPPEFSDKLMIDMPEIYVDYDLGAFLKKQVHFERINLNLKELVVMKNEKGELNLNSLKVVKDKQAPSTEEKAGKPEFKIDVLQLRINKVLFKDYSQGTSPKTMEFNLNIDERYENITDANKLISLIVTRALMNTTIAKLADFDLKSLQIDTGDLLKGANKSAQDVFDKAKEESEKATEKIKDILPF